MAIDVKSLIVDALIELCNEKPLAKISISDIQKKSGVSRQTFYNHFRDKNDLIQYIYLNRIITNWKSADSDLDYCDSLLDVFDRYVKYHTFLKQALSQSDQNCLREFMLDYCKKFDLEWHQRYYGSEPMPDALRFATEYHAVASMSITIAWILSDMPSPPHVIAENIARMRDAGLSPLLYAKKGSPYSIPDDKEKP